MKMTNAEAIETLRANYPDAYYEQLREAVDAAIEALKAQDAAGDTISRADVEQTVEDNILFYTHSNRPIDQDADTECHKAIRTALRMLRKDLRKLPSAQPDLSAYSNKLWHNAYERGKAEGKGERKTGQWTKDNTCPFCGFEPWYERDIHRLSFCPNCGADMRGEEK